MQNRFSVRSSGIHTHPASICHRRLNSQVKRLPIVVEVCHAAGCRQHSCCCPPQAQERRLHSVYTSTQPIQRLSPIRIYLPRLSSDNRPSTCRCHSHYQQENDIIHYHLHFCSITICTQPIQSLSPIRIYLPRLSSAFLNTSLSRADVRYTHNVFTCKQLSKSDPPPLLETKKVTFFNDKK